MENECDETKLNLSSAIHLLRMTGIHQATTKNLAENLLSYQASKQVTATEWHCRNSNTGGKYDVLLLDQDTGNFWVMNCDSNKVFPPAIITKEE